MTPKNNNSQVAIVMGSDSDLPTMQSCSDTLKEFGINPIVRIISAHRTPDIAADFADNAKKNGIKVIIAAAGMAAHLAGALAGRTPLPIIGVPMQASTGPTGLDALYSTVNPAYVLLFLCINILFLQKMLLFFFPIYLNSPFPSNSLFWLSTTIAPR